MALIYIAECNEAVDAKAVRHITAQDPDDKEPPYQVTIDYAAGNDSSDTIEFKTSDPNRVKSLMAEINKAIYNEIH